MKKLLLLVAMVCLVTTGYGVDLWNYGQANSQTQRSEYVTLDNAAESSLIYNSIVFGIVDSRYAGAFSQPVHSYVEVYVEFINNQGASEVRRYGVSPGSTDFYTGVHFDYVYYTSVNVIGVSPSSDDYYIYW